MQSEERGTLSDENHDERTTRDRSPCPTRITTSARHEQSSDENHEGIAIHPDSFDSRVSAGLPIPIECVSPVVIPPRLRKKKFCADLPSDDVVHCPKNYTKNYSRGHAPTTTPVPHPQEVSRTNDDSSSPPAGLAHQRRQQFPTRRSHAPTTTAVPHTRVSLTPGRLTTRPPGQQLPLTRTPDRRDNSPHHPFLVHTTQHVRTPDRRDNINSSHHQQRRGTRVHTQHDDKKADDRELAGPAGDVSCTKRPTRTPS